MKNLIAISALLFLTACNSAESSTDDDLLSLMRSALGDFLTETEQFSTKNFTVSSYVMEIKDSSPFYSGENKSNIVSVESPLGHKVEFNHVLKGDEQIFGIGSPDQRFSIIDVDQDGHFDMLSYSKNPFDSDENVTANDFDMDGYIDQRWIQKKEGSYIELPFEGSWYRVQREDNLRFIVAGGIRHEVGTKKEGVAMLYVLSKKN